MKKGSDNYKALVEAYNTRYNNPREQKRKIKLSNIPVTFQSRRADNI